MPVASAASVASELLAFHREPVVHRPRYLHGQQPLPAGHLVLRFALGRFPHGWARDLAPAEREEVRTAALEFVRQVCLWERATHYHLLCLPRDANRDAVRENYHLLIALIHPDRHEPGSPSWPTGCAQRANQAYETLADARARAQYDAGLVPVEAAAFEARAREAAGVGSDRRRPRSAPGAVVAKRAIVVAGVIVTLFVVQSWWVGGLKPEHSLLERAMPSSLRWGGPLPDSPRFIAGTVAPSIDAGQPLEPLKEPRRLPPLASWVPALPEARAEKAAGPAPPPALRAAAELSPSRDRTASAPAPVKAPALGVAPAPAQGAQPAPAVQVVQPTPAAKPAPAPAPAAEPPLRLAQAGPAPPIPDTPARDQVEGVVALLVGFYDAGDSERLVGLIDPDSLGFWQGYRLRTAYSEFFSSTRSRRLRMERLTWRHNGAVAEARGEATVVAEYADGRPRLERRVPIELDIAMRAGAARITRLVLFPGG